MRATSYRFVHIVATFLLAVGYSIPVAAQQAGSDDRIEDLLGQLRGAEGPMAARIANEILTEWSKSGSAAIDLLLRRGKDALESGDPLAAIEHLTAAIDHDPAFTAAYNLRASAFYLRGDIGPALDDLREVLVRNGNHFEAMQLFAVILAEMGREADALELFRRSLSLYPADENSGAFAAMLAETLEGKAL